MTELPPLLTHLDLEDDMKHYVAQLLRQLLVVTPLDGLDELVALLKNVAPHGVGGLLPVPGAAPGAAQALHKLPEASVGAGVLAVATHLDSGRLYAGPSQVDKAVASARRCYH